MNRELDEFCDAYRAMTAARRLFQRCFSESEAANQDGLDVRMLTSTLNEATFRLLSARNELRAADDGN
ncbi:hypothetical protein AB4Y45_40885 [Paraburkholderia sp. EG287A]|uniref:hypothetical protein n=1 Tax=unclassified Paraburkholderia TaxID=2615204 RepID=UPI0034D2E66F